ncbi:hypothetical protein [Kineococcus aurantiacus]|uniref:Uncharacterized protein n=1 Tax=Kineococcus aurantiacus TaxID=37633 RepID=A0A7Y9J2R7_9ACTN|nr:hypothetical protein [Kineococcus aurantiacus]NYD24547.1 hypothetical protein [Kineococcus aurantiacus]
MTRQRTGRGPLAVSLHDSGAGHPRLSVGDGHGLVVVLPVPVGALPRVRHHLADPGTGGACDVELLDDRGEVASRWGSVARPGEAAALALALVAADRTLARARVVPVGGGG